MQHKNVFFLVWIFLSGTSFFAQAMAAEFVGRDKCESCHAEQVSQWSNSHHDLAMQEVNDKTVLGDFDNASLTHYDVKSSFFMKDGLYMVRTEGPDGKLQDFAIKYTFGVVPLQQYLIEFPGGRLQALSLAWDSRPKEQGGQRWFHLYPDEKIAYDDELHWTRPSQNWNSMCAECHSTRLEKNYDPVSRSFSTSWKEINVSCEACHGPGSDHISWADHKPGWEKFKDDKGLTILLDERKNIQWKTDGKTQLPVRSSMRTTDREIEMCARCHSRRSPISKNYTHSESLMDQYLPATLDEGLYHADGQIDNEVYVYGSFRQSKMYQAGVTCSDCHEPHSLKLRLPGDGVCLQCHQAEKYAQQKHHFHSPESTGASCAECHMPAKNYMVVDPRHDHSMRIPRPDLSLELGVPNACNNCHTDESADWADKQLRVWYGHKLKGFQSYAHALNDQRENHPAAGNELAALIRNTNAPDIARATAVAHIGPYISGHTVDVLATGIADPDPAVRAATLNALEHAPLNLRVRLAFPLLDDDVRAVRILAARLLAPLPAGELKDDQRALLEKGIKEYIDSQEAMAERPEAQTNLAGLYAALGNTEKAISAYSTAIELNPVFTPAYVNLADLYRSQGDEKQAMKVLRDAIKVVPNNADLHHALGLSLVRQKQTGQAIKELKLAATLNTDNTRYSYIYAIALNSTGQSEQAVLALQGALAVHPDNVDILTALVSINRDMGNQQAAKIYAGKLRAITGR
ncbi:MAG: tetratricopeptide repeat protein [Pseudomonadota bacterium]|nr:tetratricopeptide repeat protein [Pseudomonadota bacterium]